MHCTVYSGWCEGVRDAHDGIQASVCGVCDARGHIQSKLVTWNKLWANDIRKLTRSVFHTGWAKGETKLALLSLSTTGRDGDDDDEFEFASMNKLLLRRNWRHHRPHLLLTKQQRKTDTAATPYSCMLVSARLTFSFNGTGWFKV